MNEVYIEMKFMNNKMKIVLKEQIFNDLRDLLRCYFNGRTESEAMNYGLLLPRSLVNVNDLLKF